MLNTHQIIIHNPLVSLTLPGKGTPFIDGLQLSLSASAKDRAEGCSLVSEGDVWDFLQRELSPQAFERNRDIDPFEHRVGFVMGYLIQMFRPQAAVARLDASFLQGFQIGDELSEEDQAAGYTLVSEGDVWDFLQRELSPQALERDRAIDQLFPIASLPFEHRIGFVTGYVTRLFATPEEITAFLSSETNA